MKDKITSVSFWKRDPDAVNQVDEVSLDYQERRLAIRCDSAEKSKSLSEKEFITLRDSLDKVLDRSKLDERYYAHRYEDDKDDYNIKFFLTIRYADKTYFSYKGTHPFKEAGYQEIVSCFDKIIDDNK